jgi:hypothetical protein
MKARMFAWELPKFKVIYCHHPVLFLKKVYTCTRSMCTLYIYQFVVGCINLIFGLLCITIYIYIPEEQSFSFHRPLEGHNPAIFQVMNTGASDLKRKHYVFVRGLTNFKVSAGVCPLGDDGQHQQQSYEMLLLGCCVVIDPYEQSYVEFTHHESRSFSEGKPWFSTSMLLLALF